MSRKESVAISAPVVAAARSLMRTDGKSRRAAAIALGVSYSGLSAALVRKTIKKETRGRKCKLTTAEKRKVTCMRDKEKKKGSKVTAGLVHRTLGLGRAKRGKKKVSVRTEQRVFGADGHRYLPKKNKHVVA